VVHFHTAKNKDQFGERLWCMRKHFPTRKAVFDDSILEMDKEEDEENEDQEVSC
jgi:hypothetical protein